VFDIFDMFIEFKVILSVQLPFAIVPLIRFTSDKRLMGQFKNPIWVMVLSSLCAVLIISLNIWLVGQNIYALFASGSSVLLAVGVLVLPVALALLGLLAYVAFRGIPTMIKKKMYGRYHEDGRELTEMDESTETVEGASTPIIMRAQLARTTSITLVD
jgi:membrane protein implicated in regulation of membrane protease activity